MPFRLFKRPSRETRRDPPTKAPGAPQAVDPGAVARESGGRTDSAESASDAPEPESPSPRAEEWVRDEAERRIAEVERRHREAEERLQRASAAGGNRGRQAAETAEHVVAGELRESEARLTDAQRRSEEALKHAADRLEEVEARADEAEAPATPGSEVDATKALASPIDINEASYEQLQGLRLSATQTGRVLAYREREGSFKSLDELDRIPGFSRAQLAELKRIFRV